MAILVRAFQFFAGFGAVATVPLTTTFMQGKDIKLPGGGIRLVRDQGQEQEVIKPQVEKRDLRQGEVLQAVKGMMDKGKGDPSCFWLPNQKTGYELLMCVYKEELESPILFHYDSRDQLKEGKQVRQIEQITFTSGPTTMRLEGGRDVDIPRTAKLYLTTQLKKKNTTLLPKKHCKISGNQGDYQLTCSDSNNSGDTMVGKIELETLHENKHKTISR